MWLAVGYGIAVLLPPPAPAMGILVGAIADPVASWIGSAGRNTPGKTLRGSGGHFAVALGLLVLAGLPWGRAAIAAAVGTVLERCSGSVNDNVVVAPGVAAAVTLLA
jgi:dolichol kinase